MPNTQTLLSGTTAAFMTFAAYWTHSVTLGLSAGLFWAVFVMNARRRR